MQNGGTQILIDGEPTAIIVALIALIVAAIALWRLGRVSSELAESKTRASGPNLSSIRDTATKAAEEVLRKAFGDQINISLTPQAIEQLMPKLVPAIISAMSDDEELTQQMGDQLLKQLAAKDLGSFMNEGSMAALKSAVEDRAVELAESAFDDGDNWQVMVDLIAKWCVTWMEEQLKDTESEFYSTMTYCVLSKTCENIFEINYDDLEDKEESDQSQ